MARSVDFRASDARERAAAEATTLPKVRERAIRAAEAWDEMASRQEQIDAGNAQRLAEQQAKQ